MLKYPEGSTPIPVIIKNSPARTRAEKAGFRFMGMIGYKQTVEDGGKDFREFITFRGKMQCVCGKIEYFMAHFTRTHFPSYIEPQLPYYDGLYYDFALAAEDSGAFSEEHLRADGYSEEHIKQIRRAWPSPMDEAESRLLRSMSLHPYQEQQNA